MSNKKMIKFFQVVTGKKVVQVKRAVPRGLSWNGNYLVWVKGEGGPRYYRKDKNDIWVRGSSSELYC